MCRVWVMYFCTSENFDDRMVVFGFSWPSTAFWSSAG
ncbi:Uncharacterised protein [Mycobacterium tuberculosis]|nr:Uncharacterised protein [Mycobacterium tuberculosis]